MNVRPEASYPPPRVLPQPDYLKCFDLIPRAVVLTLALGLGMDPRMCCALGAMCEQLRRAFKVAGSLGSWRRTTNGILQGCSLSVILVNHDVDVGDRLPPLLGLCGHGGATAIPRGSWLRPRGRTRALGPPAACRPGRGVRDARVVVVCQQHLGNGPWGGGVADQHFGHGRMVAGHGTQCPRGQILLLDARR